MLTCAFLLGGGASVNDNDLLTRSTHDYVLPFLLHIPRLAAWLESGVGALQPHRECGPDRQHIPGRGRGATAAAAAAGSGFEHGRATVAFSEVRRIMHDEW